MTESRSEMNAILLHVKKNERTLVDICGCKFPINVHNFMQKHSAKAKISYKVVGVGVLFCTHLVL